MVSAYSPEAKLQRNNFFSFLPLNEFNSPGAGTENQPVAQKKQRFPCTAALAGEQLQCYWDKVKSNGSSKVCFGGLGLCSRTFSIQLH